MYTLTTRQIEIILMLIEHMAENGFLNNFKEEELEIISDLEIDLKNL